MPSVICFDIGGVLVGHCRSWLEGCRRAGVPAREPEWLRSQAAIARRRAVVQTYQRGQCTTAEYYADLAAALSGLYTVEEVASVHRAWLLEEYPGVEQLVRELNADPRVTTACLSNTNAAHWEQLVPADGRSRFPSCVALQVRLASHRLGASKPDAEVFDIAQKRLGVAPREILFFDDGPANVEAALQAGWHAALVDFRRDTAFQLREVLREALGGF